MTRLFIRFYLGVILILFIAFLIQVYVFRGSTEAENIAVVEDVLGGGALSVRDDLIEGGEANFEQTLMDVRSRFAYPVNIVNRSDRAMPPTTDAKLKKGKAVFHLGKIDVALPETDLLVELGPLPQFAGPTRGDILVGLGSLFLLVAAAIAVLMRPISRQFRTVEQTAIAITAGDLSARIAAGDRKRSLPIVSAFNTMADRVEALLRSQQDLLQAVSHELRTPLARIKFATELVRMAENDANRERRIDAIDEATDRLDELVGELLDYTRLDEGIETASCELVQVDELVAQAVAIHSPLYPHVCFTVHEVPSIHLLVYRTDLLRAISNLVSNAGKYSKTTVQISISESEDHVEIAVEDDGHGIDEKDYQVVLEPFKRLGGQSQPGTGLGLALVHRICQRLHGHVTIGRSCLGGALFQIQLPRSSSVDVSRSAAGSNGHLQHDER
ncbi:MAG: ATP-binding protein [Candidatus Paceibacterota bacterium]